MDSVDPKSLNLACRTHSGKAFEYQEGQFVCHVYSDLTGSERVIIDDLVRIFLEGAHISPRWSAIFDSSVDPHLTLLRGHRALYYNHIDPLLSGIRQICLKHKPIRLLLSDLQIFRNQERTKEFLCLVTTPSFESGLKPFKDELKDLIDQFALKLTDEDESPDTLTHCSIMSRTILPEHHSGSRDTELVELNRLCDDLLGEVPVLVSNISSIKLSIGCKTHEFQLLGR